MTDGKYDYGKFHYINCSEVGPNDDDGDVMALYCDNHLFWIENKNDSRITKEQMINFLQTSLDFLTKVN